MRLWMRLALLMSLLAVIPVTAVGLTAIQVSARRASQTTEERLRAEAGVQADVVGRWVADQARLVLAMPQLYGDALSRLSPAAQAAFPELVYRLVPSAITVVLVDGNGLAVAPPVFSTGDPSRAGSGRTVSSAERARDLVARLDLAEILADPGVAHVEDAWMPGGMGTRASFPVAVVASRGERPEDVRILGVEVGLEIGDDLVRAARDRETARERALAVLDRAGTPLLGASPILETQRLRPLLDTEKFVDWHFEDSGVYGSIAPIPNTPGWSLVVAEVVVAPTAEILRAWLAPLLVAGAAGALGLAVITAGWVSRPVERLRDAAMAVAEGRLGTRAEVDSSDEIGELARAFDHMSSRLEANRAEIEAFNRELQQRVDERTSELRDAQEELVRAGQLAAVAELGAGLAHELNNPLAAVLGIAQVLRARSPDDAFLADLEREADRCREVVQTLRRVQGMSTRSSGGMAEVDPSEFPVVQVSDVLRQVHDLVGGAFRQRGVSLELVEAQEPLLVRLDPVQGSRLVASVLNALRAGLEPGATVRVRAARDGGTVVVALEPDRPVAADRERRDDWMASGHSLWVARQLLARLGGRLDEVRPDDSNPPGGQGSSSSATPPAWHIVLLAATPDVGA